MSNCQNCGRDSHCGTPLHGVAEGFISEKYGDGKTIKYVIIVVVRSAWKMKIGIVTKELYENSKCKSQGSQISTMGS